MSPPLRPFLWIAFPAMLGGYRQIIEIAKAHGFGGIAPRAGQGGWNDKSLRPEDVRAIRDAGLDCLPWIFSEPSHVEAEVDAFRRLEDEGATHLIIDAEIPWDREPKAAERAAWYGELAARQLTVPVYDAPWPVIDWHQGYPEKAFRWVAGRLLQTYWTEIGWTAARTLLTARAQWARREDPERILPIGITYGRTEMQRWKIPQLPPGELLDQDLATAAPLVRGGWYTAEAAGPGTLARIAELAGLVGTGNAPTDPPAPLLVPPVTVREPGLLLGDGGPAHDPYYVDREEDRER